MSTGITMIEFEKREVKLSSEMEEGPPYTVNGVALGEGDVTRGSSGIEKYWPAEELKKAAETLKGKNLVEDHQNQSRGVVGKVTKAGYKEGEGVIYEAELYDEDLAEKIKDELLEVSIRGFHKDVDEMEEHEDTGAKVVEDIEFDNLSIVPSGASPSNTLQMGSASELSAAELSSFVEELEEIEAGDFVQWGDDMHGVVLTMPEDGEVEVDVYEQKDDKWRSTGETTNVSVESLSLWEVEEEDIGAAEDDSDEEDSDEESEDEEENQEGGVVEEHRFETEDAAQDAAESMGTEGAHRMEFDDDEEAWVPGTTHQMYLDNVEEASRGRGEGEEIELDTDAERAEHAGEHRNPDDEFDDEYYEEASADEGSEESDVEELQEWEFHEPTWDGTTESDWSTPSMEDFDTDDLSEIATHFLISQTGFPPENFSDLALPVVEPSGELNLNALQAVKGGHGASQVDGLPDEMVSDIEDYVNNLANKHFDAGWGEDEDEEENESSEPSTTEVALDAIDSYEGDAESMEELFGWMFTSEDVSTQQVAALRAEANDFLDREDVDSFGSVSLESFRGWLDGEPVDDEETDGSREPRTRSPVTVLSGDDLRTAEGASKKDANLNHIEVVHNMTNIEEELEELDEPVAVEKDDLEELQEKADRMDEMSDTLSDLKERTDVLDSVDSEKVEELAEGEDPVVLEKDEYEELTAEAEQVKAVYAETLSEEGPFSADELVDKFSIEELRSKYDEAGHELEEELEAEPKSGDVDEEELEKKADEEDVSEEELEQNEAIEEKQAELREKILNGD